MSTVELTTGMKEVTDITNTYKVKGQIFTRKQRVSSFITRHPQGRYTIYTREGQATIVDGVMVEGTVSVKALVDKAYTEEV